MAWARKSGSAAKYQTREHRGYCAHLKDELKQQGYLTCTADECLFDTRIITNPNGRDRNGLHAGHEPDGVTYRGPQHNACNIHEAAKRARARQDVTALRW